MEKDKQIEEIKDVMIHTCKRIRSFNDDFMQSRYAEALYNAGYRKTSDIAREIIEEAEKIFMFTCSSLTAYTDWQNFKKKYIGKDTNVTTKESEKYNVK